MRKIKIGSRLLQIGLLIYLIENFYFGWNKVPMSDLEIYADNTVVLFIFFGLVFYFMPIMDLYKNAVKKSEANQNMKMDAKTVKETTYKANDLIDDVVVTGAVSFTDHSDELRCSEMDK